MIFYRLLLAALHYNYNGSREVAQTSGGVAKYAVQYPRFRKGEHTVQPIKQKASYGQYSFSQFPLYLDMYA